jgi:tetratricopeptide (TPR) repeat protein
MRRIGTSVMAGLFVAALTGSVQAQGDVVTDCMQSRHLDTRVRACSDIIRGSGFSTEQRAMAFRNRGLARADAGARDQAIADLSEAIRLNPSDTAALSGRANVRLARGQTEAAISDLTAALKLAPRNATLLTARGHAHLVKGNADSAIDDFTDAIGINPSSASAFNNRGLAWRKKGDLANAIADYTSAIMLNPIYALAYNNRGYAHEAKGARAEAISDFTRALQLDPSLSGAAAGLKRLKAEGTHMSDARRFLEEGKQLVETNCARCHAVGATGPSPNPKATEFRLLQRSHPIQALREPLTRGIAAPHDEMPKFVLADADVDKIVAYINALPLGGGWQSKTSPARK